jgi:hypothetical protein
VDEPGLVQKRNGAGGFHHDAHAEPPAQGLGPQQDVEQVPPLAKIGDNVEHVGLPVLVDLVVRPHVRQHVLVLGLLQHRDLTNQVLLHVLLVAHLLLNGDDVAEIFPGEDRGETSFEDTTDHWKGRG